MSILREILIALLALWAVWRFVRRALRPGSPAEPVDDPFAPVPATRKGGPKGKAAAVAIEEPDDNDSGTGVFTPRQL
jgi:hypothetical protein